MSIPKIEAFQKRVIGIKKDRDYKVLELLALNPEIHQSQVATILDIKMSQPRISQIIRDNQTLYLDMVINMNPLATKGGRVVELIKHYRRKSNGGSHKDVADLLEQVRKEVEGDKALIDQSTHITYKQVKVVIDDNSHISSALQSRINSTRSEQIQGS